jgi:hypothetical protein
MSRITKAIQRQLDANSSSNLLNPRTVAVKVVVLDDRSVDASQALHGTSWSARNFHKPSYLPYLDTLEHELSTRSRSAQLGGRAGSGGQKADATSHSGVRNCLLQTTG